MAWTLSIYPTETAMVALLLALAFPTEELHNLYFTPVLVGTVP